MRTLVVFLLVSALGIIWTRPVAADEPTCSVYNGNGFCSYRGKVAQAYVNDNNWILVYYDTPMASGAPSAVGISGVTNFSAAIYKWDNNERFGQMLYSTLLTAQARGAEIVIHMRSPTSGYLTIDRIWIYE